MYWASPRTPCSGPKSAASVTPGACGQQVRQVAEARVHAGGVDDGPHPLALQRARSPAPPRHPVPSSPVSRRPPSRGPQVFAAGPRASVSEPLQGSLRRACASCTRRADVRVLVRAAVLGQILQLAARGPHLAGLPAPRRRSRAPGTPSAPSSSMSRSSASPLLGAHRGAVVAHRPAERAHGLVELPEEIGPLARRPSPRR